MKHNTHLIKVNHVDQLKSEMKKIGADEPGIRLMAPKGELMMIKVQQVSLKAANILKQEMLARGAEAVLHKEVSMLTKELSDVLLMGSKKQFKEIIPKLSIQPFGLKQIAKEIDQVLKMEELQHQRRFIEGKGISISMDDKTVIMGILNVTPDSFSDGGKYNHLEKAIAHAKKMVEDGADIIDVGGESTRPGHTPVSVEDELQRVLPIIEKLSKEISVPISIDTYKAEVAKKAVEAGANLINDVWGFKKDADMAKVAAELEVPVILMHNRKEPNYQSLMDDVIADLRESIDIATKAGVDPSRIILDPGIGFGKTYHHNLLVMNRLDEIVAMGYPVLLGTSRKSMIGLTLDLPVTERMEGTAATIAMGIMKGVNIIRVHDVKEMKRVATMMDAMVYMKEQ